MGEAGIPVAVVGLGERGRRWARLASMARGLSVSALLDPKPEVAKAARNALALDVPVFSSLQEAVEGGGLSLRGAIVALPVPSRLRACREAISFGLSVLVEPPMAGSPREAAGALSRARRRGVPVLQALWLRHSPPLRAMRRALREGHLGAPIGGLLVRLHKTGEGETWPGTVQHLDALLSLVGAPVVCRKEGYAVVLDFGEGVEFGLAVGPSGDPMEGLLLVCEHGALLWDGRAAFVREGRRGLRWRPEDPLGFRWPERGEPRGKFEPLPPDPGPSGEEAVLARFRGAIEGAKQGPADEEALSTLAALEACALAHELGVPQRPTELMERAPEGRGDVEAEKGESA